MQDLIIVRAVPTGWTADFAGHSDASSLREAFGTTELPLPLTARADEGSAIALVEHKNPGATVMAARNA